MQIDIVNLLSSSIVLAIPLIVAAVGGAYSVRGGIMALGLEGQMLTGAFLSAVGAFYTGSAFVGLLCGIAGGMVIGLMHGVLSVKYKVNQVISGIGLNLLAIAGSTLLMQEIWNSRGFSAQLPEGKFIRLGFLENIPVLFRLFGNLSSYFYFMILIIAIGWYILFKTNFGLRLRMVGENPKAAMTLGINVVKMKYIAVMIGGALSGIAGSYLTLGYLGLFTREITAGRGYTAVVVNILGGYHPVRIVVSGFIFSIANALQITLQGSEISTYLIAMIPYVVTILVLIIGGKGIKAPKGLAKYHDE